MEQLMTYVLHAAISLFAHYFPTVCAKLPWGKRFCASRDLSAALMRHKHLFASANEHRYSLHALAQVSGGDYASRAMDLCPHVERLAQLSPTLSMVELENRFLEIRRTINIARELVQRAAISSNHTQTSEIYSQLQPGLNELVQAVELIIADRLFRFPSSLNLAEKM